ncbi:imidazole glycerol phosphate synthase subunit HisH [Aquipuribacter nitratireducens]|uniref:Imidazole glycerol phosphate synthase subunit HisH n=1 Tax=Aquipuribacter nitratireducens TaxID=650104 RepID=A0ABW0GRN0_9MICO
MDHGSGNVRSAVRALERVGADVELTADPQAGLDADGLVVPGVGAFAAVVEGVRRVRGDVVVGRRLAGGRPVLGICVGLQVMFESSTEPGAGDRDGLGQWPGTVERLPVERVPHMGWNTVEAPADSVLFAGLADERFYFVHSYGVLADGVDGPAPVAALGTERLAPPTVTWAEHEGCRFVAAVENGALSATQFHPEKSGDAGAALLEHWVRRLA